MKNSFWQRIRFKFRVSVLNENTLNEVWHMRLSRAGLILMLTALFVFTFSLIAVLIWFTPLNRYLPGYNANLRQDIVEQVARVDSLSSQLTLQRQYVEVMRNIMSGEVATDTIPSLDSMAIVQRTRLLEAKNAVTEEFIGQYEHKEREQLTLFTQPVSTAVVTMFRPARGFVKQKFLPDKQQYGIVLQTANKQTVSSVLSGSVIAVMPSMTEGWCVIIQHENDYISVYKNLDRPQLSVSDRLDAGTIIGSTNADILSFELWQKGRAVNPENMIIFQ